MTDTPVPAAEPNAAADATTLRHGAFEDVQALFAGTLCVAMALMLFNQAGLIDAPANRFGVITTNGGNLIVGN